jgi:hypothetical protein
MFFSPDRSTEAELAPYPLDIQRSIRLSEDAALVRYESWLRFTGVDRNEAGYVSHHDDAGNVMSSGDGPTSYWFGLTYASWLVIPRLSLQEMPPSWQAQFYALLEEAIEKHGLKLPEGTCVNRRVKGRFVSNDHWNDYRRGAMQRAVEVDREKGWDEHC